MMGCAWDKATTGAHMKIRYEVNAIVNPRILVLVRVAVERRISSRAHNQGYESVSKDAGRQTNREQQLHPASNC
jgi:hypothetical protein